MRSGRDLRFLVLFASLAVAMPASPGSVMGAATLPSGFVDTEYATGFANRLTAMAFAPDGRLFVSEKDGNLRIVNNGTLATAPFLSIPTNTDTEHGLKAIAFDPAYTTPGSRFIYVYYTDPITLKNKISRFNTSSDPNVAEAGSEVVLLDGIDSDIYHDGGALAFGPDGKLYVSTGDANLGRNGQDLGKLNGKILRINPDGTIPSDNPFVGQPGVRPEIWAYGLRNPFTFAFDGPTGRLFINDVGNATSEEVNVGAAGANYGWPTCEGPCNDTRFVDPLYSYRHDSDPGKAVTGGVFYRGSMFPAEFVGDYFFGDYVGNYIRRLDAGTANVADFATNALNPVDLDIGPDGALYYLSVEARKVHRIAYGEQPPPPQPGSNLFMNGGFEQSPIMPWRASLGNPARGSVARDTAVHAGGAASLRVDITTAGKDHQLQVLQPQIALTSGSEHTLSFAARASAARPLRVAFQRNSTPYPTYFQRVFQITTDWQIYTVAFTPTADDPLALFAVNLGSVAGQVWLDDMSLAVPPPPPPPEGQPPAAQIDAPLAETTYRAGDVISFSGSATDPEDGPLGPGSLLWEVVFHHDTHTHPHVDPFSGASSGSFTASATGEASANVWYRIHLTAGDSDGNTHEVTRDVVPLTSRVTLATQPSGLNLNLDGSPIAAPFTFTGVENFQREISAPPNQTLGGISYRFVSWSDSGLATHNINTPEADTTFTAVYEVVPNTNLIGNSGFENTGNSWLQPWRIGLRNPAKATVAKDTIDPASGSASLRVNITTSGTRDWHVQVLQPKISLVAGQPHTLTFRARSAAARNIRIAFQRNSAPYPVYFQQTVAIGTTWQLFTINFTPAATDSVSLFNFNLGPGSGSIWLDDVALIR